MHEPTFAAPNYFDFGRAEICQDAFIAWLASWADQRLADRDSELHALGSEFVRALAQATGKVAPLPANIRVECQRELLDVVIEVGDEMVIAIEDKVGARGRARQLYRHAHRAMRWKNGNGEVWPSVCLLFVTTGRSASGAVVTNPVWGTFDRAAFLELLPVDHSSEVVREFRDRLEVMELERVDWRATPVRSWSRAGGWARYRSLIEKELRESGSTREWELLRERGIQHLWIRPQDGLRVCVWPNGKGFGRTHQDLVAKASRCSGLSFRILSPAFDRRAKQTFIELALTRATERGIPVDGLGRLDETALRLQLEQLTALVRLTP